MRHREKKHRTAWKKFIVVFLIIFIGVMVFLIVRRNGSNNVIQSVLVGRGDVVQEVSVTGRIKPVEDISLAFENGGKVSQVFAKIGDNVYADQLLVQLDTSELSAQLLQAEAGVESARAKLDELIIGTRQEEIQVKETELEKAREDLSNYYRSVSAILSDAYSKADDAVRSKTDDLFINDDTSMPQPTFSITNSQVQVDFIAGRIISGQELSALKGEIAPLSPSSARDVLDVSLASAQKHLSVISNFLAVSLDAVSNTSGVSASNITTYKTNIGVGRTNVNSALSSVLSQSQLISSQKITVTKFEKDLALDKAGPTSEQIASQSALIKQAEANKQSIEAQMEKMALRSPISGLVTKQDAKLGEIVAAHTQLVSVISQEDLEIEANVPEVDIGRVAVGNPVSIKLDAFQDEEFNGKISYIDPGETVIDGVVNFKITVVFLSYDSRFKTGLTASLDIETMKKTGVIVAPQFAVIENDKGTFMRKIYSDSFLEVPVKIGIRGRDGTVEILSGVQEGDRVANVGFKPK